MKNLVKAAVVAAGIFSFTATHAQDHNDNTGHKISRDTKAVGHKTAEVSAKGAAAITDKKYEGKCGPNGETIYINKNSHYFYVDKKGKREYLKKSQLRDTHDMKM
jgi:uncharacterized low-complexity protein